MEKKIVEAIKALGASVLLLLGMVGAEASALNLKALAELTELANLSIWLSMLFSAFSTLVGLYLLLRLEDRRLRYLFTVLFLLVGLLTLDLRSITGILFVSLMLGAILPTEKRYGVTGLWRGVRSLKSHGGLAFLLVTSLLIFINASQYNDLVLSGLVSVVNSYVPGGQSLSPLVDQMIPDTITPEEISAALSYLKGLPEWNLLTPQQQQQVIDQLKEQLRAQKGALREALKKSLSNVKVKFDEETVKQLLSSTPQLRVLYDYLFVFLILGALAVASLVLEVSSILVFLFLAIPVWVMDRGKTNKSQEC